MQHLDFGFNLNDGYGIPYNLGNSKTSLVPVVFGGTLADGTSRCNYSSESDQGPYQISTMATIEGLFPSPFPPLPCSSLSSFCFI